MDWRAITFDWNRARAFLVTAEEGSLSAAARALGMAQPTLGRQVTALEEELGLALFERHGRGLSLTPAGLSLLEQARAMGAAAGRLSLAAAGQSEDIAGVVRVSAGELYAAHLLPPILARLRRAQPAIQIELVGSNRLSDLRRREADIAIRNARPDDPELIGRKLGEDGAQLYAAESYLAGRAPIRAAEELALAEFIGMEDTEALVAALNAHGVPVTAEAFGLRAVSHLAHWELVKAGAGVGLAPVWLGDATPGVGRALPGLAPIAYPVWLAAHRDLRTSRRIRLVHDLLAAEITAALRAG